MASPVAAFNYHKNYKWSTFDNDNDVNGGSCSVSYGGPYWFGGCHHMNPFGSWNKLGALGISYRGADNSMPNNDSTYDNLDYVAFAIRTHNTGGDGINVSNGIGGLTYNGVCTNCDHTVCATCSGSPTSCI
mmetsp:Transcript_13799/g.1242  ORF Transcript_13799/g.1242 Transcript_13799/m.1242 type:complete len:131 (+) Transcript_13799:266-658(+)